MTGLKITGLVLIVISFIFISVSRYYEFKHVYHKAAYHARTAFISSFCGLIVIIVDIIMVSSNM